MPRIDAKKICVIRLSALGDIVHALALVNGLRHGYPDAEITWILQPLSMEVVKYQPAVDRFILFRRGGGLSAVRELRQTLRKIRFDLCIVPQVSAKAGLIAAMVNARYKLGFDLKRSRELHWFVTNRHLDPGPATHVQAQMLEFLEYLGINDYEPQWDFVFTDDEQQWRTEFFKDMKRPVISFAVASSKPEKDWTAAGYAEVMDRVARDLGGQALIIGGPGQREKAMAADIVSRCSRKPLVGLVKPVRQTMLQISGSDLVVAPDTGPLHMAVAMNIPTVGLYGFSNPRRCGPYRRFHDLLIDRYNDPEDFNKPITRRTKTGRMQRITPDDVLKKIILGLERYPRSRIK